MLMAPPPPPPPPLTLHHALNAVVSACVLRVTDGHWNISLSQVNISIPFTPPPPPVSQASPVPAGLINCLFYFGAVHQIIWVSVLFISFCASSLFCILSSLLLIWLWPNYHILQSKATHTSAHAQPPQPTCFLTFFLHWDIISWPQLAFCSALWTH